MALISKLAVLSEATVTARRFQFVSRDPAVIKAAKQAGRDLARASSSVSELAIEFGNSWKRAG